MIRGMCSSRKYAYFDRKRAKRDASDASRKYGHTMEVYRCKECRKYHIGTAEEKLEFWRAFWIGLCQAARSEEL
jgi:hypothetical protein